MARLTAEQVAAEIEGRIANDSDADWTDVHEFVSRVAARLIRDNLIESPDERRKRFEEWHVERFGDGFNHLLSHDEATYTNGQTNLMWLAFNAALDFGGGGGE